jgi:hypothetical protein
MRHSALPRYFQSIAAPPGRHRKSKKKYARHPFTVVQTGPAAVWMAQLGIPCAAGTGSRYGVALACRYKNIELGKMDEGAVAGFDPAAIMVDKLTVWSVVFAFQNQSVC